MNSFPGQLWVTSRAFHRFILEKLLSNSERFSRQPVKIKVWFSLKKLWQIYQLLFTKNVLLKVLILLFRRNIIHYIYFFIWQNKTNEIKWKYNNLQQNLILTTFVFHHKKKNNPKRIKWKKQYLLSWGPKLKGNSVEFNSEWTTLHSQGLTNMQKAFPSPLMLNEYCNKYQYHMGEFFFWPYHPALHKCLFTS